MSATNPITTAETRLAEGPLLVARLLRLTAGALWSLLAIVTLLFWVRRLSGRMDQPLPSGAFFLSVALLAALLWLLRLPAAGQLRVNRVGRELAPWPGRSGELRSWWNEKRGTLLHILSLLGWGTLLLVATAIVLTLPGMNRAEAVLGWLMLLASECLLVLYSLGDGTPTTADRRPAVVANAALPATPGPSFGAADLEVDDEEGEAEELLPPGVTQQMTRSRLAEGREAIEVFLRCSFAGEETFQVLHVSFCPPLMHEPDLQIDQLEGPELKIKPTLAASYGARIELRVAEPLDEAADVVLRLHAVG